MARPSSFLWLGLSHILQKRNNLRLAAFCLASAIESHGRAPANWSLRLGLMYLDQERFAEAIALLRDVLAQTPDNLAANFALGKAYLETGAASQAVLLFEGLVQRHPHSVDVKNAFGNALLANQEPDHALEVFERILASEPNDAKANSNRVAALLSLKRPFEAEAAARTALAVPGAESAPLELNLGSALMQQERQREAIAHFRRALELDPKLDEAKLRLAIALGSRALIGESVSYLERKLQREGRGCEVEEYLAVAYLCSDNFADAEAACKAIIETYGNSAQAWMTLSSVYQYRHDVSAAVKCLERSLEMRPNSFTCFSNILFLQQSIASSTAEETFARHCAWWERYREQFSEKSFRYPRTDDPHRRLKIGYVSGDLLAHPVGYLLRAALDERDRTAFEVHCFSNATNSDDLTKQIRASVDVWHEVAGLRLREIADLVHKTGIDILVDLSGHTDRSALPAFGRRPAPVQVSWLGYFHSTGTDCLDYFISDPYTTPPDSPQRYSETLVHLPNTRFCFVPYAGYPAVEQTPALATGAITFGCFNRMDKLTPEVIHAWSRILLALPGSRLLLKARGMQDDATRGNLVAKFAAHGIAEDRLDLREPSPYFFMLEEYADMDIALDPFPFNGGMTTFESLWMGVPVVTLAGEGIVARQSAAILYNLNLPELVHDSVDAYVAGALALARDLDRLAELREGMRERMRASPVGDGKRFVHDLESLYRRMWQARCQATRLPSDLLHPGKDAAPLTHFVDQEIRPAGESGLQRYCSANAPEVAFVICSIDDAKLGRLTDEIASHLADTAYELVTIRDARSLTEAYNRGARQCSAPYIVFCHDDIHLLDPGFWHKLRAHLQEFDIVGPAGTSRLVGAKWFDAGYPYLHGQMAHVSKEYPFNVNIFDGGVATNAGRSIAGDIQALDGVFIAMRRAVLEKVQYDEQTFDGFHCYDIDFTYRAYLAGFKLGATYDFAIFHESEGNFGAEWARYAERFRQKHAATLAPRPYPVQHAGQAVRYETLSGVRKAFEMEVRRANQSMMREKYGESLDAGETRHESP